MAQWLPYNHNHNGDSSSHPRPGRSSQSARSTWPRCPRKTALVLPLLIAAAALPGTMAQQPQCISLKGSTTCPAFAAASINTNLTGDFSFLAFVSSADSFDARLQNYVATTYAQKQYKDILGCSGVNLANTTALYARYTTTVLCNALVQASKQACGLSSDASTPLCANDCADFAISEQAIVATPDLCGSPGANAVPQIRADFARCSNPSDSLSGRCIAAVSNEPAECGYQKNLQGLCSFCSGSTVNSTDSCCVTANVQSRCAGLTLPTTVSMPPVFPSNTASATPSSMTSSAGVGLSGGAIAGIIVGSILGAAIILAAIIFCCVRLRRRRGSSTSSIFNTPSPSRRHSSGIQTPMAFRADGNTPATILPGARVQRMSALESASSDIHSPSERGFGSVAYRQPSTATFESPESIRGHLSTALPKRAGSLSVHSNFESSTTSPLPGSDRARDLSSPDGVASGQSEQLQFFKDYYSQDDIRPNDTVATLWAYQPRAGDEFELERGDMLKVVGIWDDGWATGIKLSDSADQWLARKIDQRDSGMSTASKHSRAHSGGEIKAFPLVCVCLPQHWRKTIEGEGTETHDNGSDRPPPSP